MSLEYRLARKDGRTPLEVDPEYTSMYVPGRGGHFPTEIEGPSRTRQEFAAECDVNEIMKRYEKAGVLTHVNRREPLYLDYSEVPDLQTAMNQVFTAEREFMLLPARVRKEFDNDPVRFVEFASKDENIDRLREWGLAKPAPKPAEPVQVEVVERKAKPAKGAQEAPKPAE